jgi:hypothetical protein
MSATTRYREMARECLREAEGRSDPAHKKSLMGIAKLYNRTALAIDAAEAAAPGYRLPQPMPKEPEIGTPWDMEDEALAVILRHRPDLRGKTFKEARAILEAEYPAKKPRLAKSV